MFLRFSGTASASSSLQMATHTIRTATAVSSSQSNDQERSVSRAVKAPVGLCAVLQRREGRDPDIGEGVEGPEHREALQERLAEHVDCEAEGVVHLRGALARLMQRRKLRHQRQKLLLEDRAPRLCREPQALRELRAHDAVQHHDRVVAEVWIRLVHHLLRGQMGPQQSHSGCRRKTVRMGRGRRVRSDQRIQGRRE